MQEDLRYTLEHIGDMLVKKLEGLAMAVKSRMKGVFITHDIHSLDRKRQSVVYNIGERVIEIRKETPDLLADDAGMAALFSDFDSLDGKLDALIKEREERLARIRGMIEIITAEKAEPALADMEPVPA